MRKERNVRLDVLRIAATLMIVFSHVAVQVLEREDFFYGKGWWASYLLMSVFRIATPIFFMLSGYLFSKKEISNEDARRRAFTRLMVPYMFFSMVGAIVYNQIEFRVVVNEFLVNLFIGRLNHLYFLLGLFVLYLLNPSIKKVLGSVSSFFRRKLIVFLLVTTALVSLGAFILEMSNVLTTVFLYWFLALGYYLFGLYFNDFEKGMKKLSSPKTLIFMLVLMIGNFGLSVWTMRMGEVSELSVWSNVSAYLQNYFSIFQMLAAISFFVFWVRMDWKFLHKIKKSLAFLSDKSYGLYLSHMMILEYLTHKTFINTYDGVMGVLGFMLIGFVVTVLLGYVVSILLSKLKYVRVVVGINDFKGLK